MSLMIWQFLVAINVVSSLMWQRALGSSDIRLLWMNLWLLFIK